MGVQSRCLGLQMTQGFGSTMADPVQQQAHTHFEPHWPGLAQPTPRWGTSTICPKSLMRVILNLPEMTFAKPIAA